MLRKVFIRVLCTLEERCCFKKRQRLSLAGLRESSIVILQPESQVGECREACVQSLSFVRMNISFCRGRMAFLSLGFDVARVKTLP